MKPIKRAFHLPSSKRRLDAELDAEFLFHLEGRIEELMEREGLSREAAESEARRRFGDVESHRAEARRFDDAMLQRKNRMDLLDAIRRETRHAARTLLRSPSFSFIAALTLALGLGAATTIFTLLDRVVLRPLPYPNADRMIHLGTLWPKIKAGEEYALSKGQFFFFKQHSNVLADLMMYDNDMLVIEGEGEHPPERVPALEVSVNTFDVLGIRPLLGRSFTNDEALAADGDPRVVMLSHGYWQRRFGGDPNVIGKRLSLGGGRGLEIIGVLPPGTAILDADADLWIRNYLNPAEPPQNNHTHHAIGVLKPDVTIEAAAADLARVQKLMIEQYPKIYSEGFIRNTGFAINVTSLRDHVVGPSISRALWLLFGAVAVVLLIAAANVANLFLVRIESRRREVAVRTALGAGRAELAIHYLAESLLLATMAAAGAIAIGAALLRIVLKIAPQSLPRLAEVSIGTNSVLFCIAAAVGFGLVFGLVPLSSTGLDIGVLRDGARSLGVSKRRELARRGLVLAQVALAVVLLAGGGLMARSFARLTSVKPGFDPNGVTTMLVSLPFARFSNNEQIAAFWRDLTTRAAAIPGVKAVGAGGSLPLDEGGCSYVRTDAPTGEVGNCMPMTSYTPGYFEALGIQVRGTLPTWSSIDAGEGPAYVTAAFAKRFWGTDDVVGKTVKPFDIGNPPFTIRGVIPEIRSNGLQNPPIEEAYFALSGPPGTKGWRPSRVMWLVVRAPNVSASAVVSGVRNVLGQIDPQVPISNIQPMETLLAQSMAQTSFTMLLLLISAVIALALSAVGIYGVISYVVGQRRAEIGIRMALGAQVTEVARLIVGQSLRLTLAGAALGVLISLGATRLLASQLYEVSPNDPLVLGGTVAVLVIVAALASFGPTRRAARIDPVEAMR